MQFKKILFVLISMLMISACQERSGEKLYEFLMVHPDQLRAEISDCQHVDPDTNELSPYCKTVMRAANDMMVMIDDQQKDPEAFGKKILRMQMEYAEAGNALQTERDKLQKLAADNASDKKIASLKSAITKLETKYNELGRENELYLNVVGFSSPE